jgi:hypothetical protein
MKPLVDINKEDRDALLKLATTDSETITPAEAHAQLSQVRHGSDPKCIGCHRKLDPLGQSFLAAGQGLSDEPSPGKLVYDNDEMGRHVSIEGRGLGDLARAITEQPEYSQCQVKRFWKWFIGYDVPLLDERLEALVGEFDKLGRRTNDFIAYLVNQPELSDSRRKFDMPSFFKVKPILNRCNSCHAQNAGAPPSFTKLPIGGDRESAKMWIEGIAEALDLSHDGEKKQMPPKAADWSLTKSDYANLRAWIADGAPSEKGERQIEKGGVQ